MDDREVFFSVVEANGFGAAAKRLETTPASVSRRVKALEQRLGVRLLQRTTRRLSLTEAGERYFREGRRLLHELDDLEQALTASGCALEGELRVIAPMSFGQRRLAPLVARFAALNNKLRISLILDDRETDLIDAAADLAIRPTHR
jgi:DNA-binding transcriptional LysR family regulator